jgi:hypothetical protein
MERTREAERFGLVASLQCMAAGLDGTPLAGGRKLRASWQTLRTLYYRWRDGGRKSSALITDYASPQHVARMPDLLTASAPAHTALPRPDTPLRKPRNLNHFAVNNLQNVLKQVHAPVV